MAENPQTQVEKENSANFWLEDIYNKIPDEEVEVVDAELEENLILKGSICRATLLSMKKLSVFPRAVVDERTRVKIWLVKAEKKWDCFGDSPNCAIYENNQLDRAKGTYIIEDKEPIASIFMEPWDANKIFKDLNKVKERINDTLVSLNQSGKKFLIVYHEYGKSIKIYERFDKVEKLRFPPVLELREHGNYLHIVRIPKIKERIPYEQVNSIKIYDYEIIFSKDVIRFNIHSFNGKAELIFNQNNESVLAVMKYKDYDEWGIKLEPRKFYMFSHRRPDWIFGRED